MESNFFNFKYFERNYNYIIFKLEYQIKIHENKNIYNLQLFIDDNI